MHPWLIPLAIRVHKHHHITHFMPHLISPLGHWIFTVAPNTLFCNHGNIGMKRCVCQFFAIFDPFTYDVLYWISPQCPLILAAAIGSLAPLILPKRYFYSLQNGLGALLSCPCSLPEVCDRLWMIGGSWRLWMPPWPGGGKLSNLCRRKSRRVAALRFEKQHKLG